MRTVARSEDQFVLSEIAAASSATECAISSAGSDRIQAAAEEGRLRKKFLEIDLASRANAGDAKSSDVSAHQAVNYPVGKPLEVNVAFPLNNDFHPAR